LPIALHTDTYQLTESLSTPHGPHALKVGGEIRHIRFACTLDHFAPVHAVSLRVHALQPDFFDGQGA